MKAKENAKNRKQQSLPKEIGEYCFPKDSLGFLLESVYEDFVRLNQNNNVVFDINTSSLGQKTRNQVFAHLQKRCQEDAGKPTQKR